MATEPNYGPPYGTPLDSVFCRGVCVRASGSVFRASGSVLAPGALQIGLLLLLFFFITLGRYIPEGV